MEPLSLGVATLLEYKMLEGAAEEAGRGALQALNRLFAVVRERFAGDAHAEQALLAIEQSQPDESHVPALAAAIDTYLDSDESFRDELEQLVAAAKNDSQAGQFVTQILDDARVGKIVNIKQARDVSF